MPEEFDYFWDLGKHSPQTDDGASWVDYGGKYWFDRKWKGFVVLNEIHLDLETGTVQADFVGKEMQDLTDYRPLARFLRWILRR